MGLFGGGMPKDEAKYMKWSVAANRKMMDQQMANAEAAEKYKNLTAKDDIAYDTASGSFLNKNPYLNTVIENATDRMVDSYNNSTVPGQLSGWARSGRFGSGLFQKSLLDSQQNLNRDISDMVSNMYMNNYGQERQMQEAARARMASQYDPLNRYAQYGTMLSNATPSAMLGRKESASPLGGAISGALSGLQAGIMTGNPYVAAGGALAGGALGAASV